MSALESLKNGGDKLDPIRVIQFIAPIAMFALIGWLFLMGMLETPEQKRSRVHEMMSDHEAVIGHPVIVERVFHIKSELQQIKAQVKENAETLQRIEAKVGD